jgi:pyruvate formate lyase activating enzyme
MSRKAFYYEASGDALRCVLCPHNCIIKKGGAGICGARENRDGVLVSGAWGEITSIAQDPVEKKPLYHFYPGSFVLSVGFKGCNLKCPYCQNWSISQNFEGKASFVEPRELVRAALEKSSPSIAYTYSEPLIWAEYTLLAGEAAKKSGIKNIFVTNGFVNPKPLKDILGVADAMNIDLKTFDKNTFAKIHKGKLKDVIKTIESVYASGCHLEITTLIVTGVNDTIEEMRGIIDFIKGIDKSLPWHISRYFPAWRYNAPPTDFDFISRVYEEASQSLKFVYCGNTRGRDIGNDTLCPDCGALLVRRSGFVSEIKFLTASPSGAVCAKCGAGVNIVI